MKRSLLLLCSLLLVIVYTSAKNEHIPSKNELISLLDTTNYPDLKQIVIDYHHNEQEKSLNALVHYFKDKYAERYYFSWKEFTARFPEYNHLYPEAKKFHYKQAAEKMERYPAYTQWELPFINLMGKEVTAYELRHLARQNRAGSIALTYYYEHENSTYLNYFIEQVKSLNDAYSSGKYDDKGNGIYEVYRGGRRVDSWLRTHAFYLASEKYDTEMQLLLIRTFIYHAWELENSTHKFRPGNHHTKGCMGLAQIAMLFPEIKGSDLWLKTSVTGLTTHIEREVREDGFQFERSIHYHVGDIDNYFYIYRLAKKNQLSLPQTFENKIQKMYEVLVEMARPDGTLPVSSDDTDNYLAEENNVSYTFTNGAILFQDTHMAYFAQDKPLLTDYWYFNNEEIKLLKTLKKEKPDHSSLALRNTGYYIMRNGWETNSLHLMISAGLNDKPDHQHADMLGISVWANGHNILSSYQVSYSKPEFPYFKNSWTKNVAIVDTLLQGQQWIPNTGGTGFGKWGILPHPQVITWKSGDKEDYFEGTHDGYQSIGVNYHRSIRFNKVKKEWIVTDTFKGNCPHSYRQIWQGNFKIIKPGRHIRKIEKDGSGVDIIIQKNKIKNIEHKEHGFGKFCTIFVSPVQESFEFVTLIRPFPVNKK